MDRIVRGVTLAGGVFMLVLGVWAFAAPRSFFDVVAPFEPYNVHFLHDLGAFQVGIGATLLLALVWTDALRVVLTGFAAGAGLHVVSHVMDGDLGGRATDVPGLFLVFAAVVYALFRRTRTTDEDETRRVREDVNR